MSADLPSGPPNATLRDVKQLVWTLLLLWLIIAALAYWSRSFFGARTALWVGVGLAALVTVALALVAAAGALAIAVVDRQGAAGSHLRRESSEHSDDAT